MAKTSQLDKAIASIEGQIDVLELAKAHLLAQQKAPKPVKARKGKLITAPDHIMRETN